MPLYQYQLYQYWYQLWQPRSRCVPFSPPFLLFLIPSFCLFLILYLPLLDFLSSFRSISTFYFPLMLFSPTPFSIPSLSFSLNAFAHSPLPFPSPSALLFLLFSLSRPPFSPSSISPSFFRFTPLLTLSLKSTTNNGKQTVDQAIRKKKKLHRLRVFKIRARNAAGGGAHLLDIREKIRAFAAGPYADLESVFKIKDGRENAKFFLL